jgi:hypothetical protein
MKNRIAELENNLEDLLNDNVIDKVKLVETSIEIGRFIESQGLSNYECIPLNKLKTLISKNQSQRVKQELIDDYYERIVLSAFKAYFDADTDEDGFEIIENGRAIKCDEFNAEIAERVGVQVIEAIVDTDWDNDFKVDFKAVGEFGKLLKKFKIPTSFTTHFRNEYADYYRRFKNIEEVAGGMWGLDLNDRSLWEYSEVEIDEFIAELEKIVSFLTLAYPLPSRR